MHNAAENKLLRLEIVQLAAALGLFLSPWVFKFEDIGPAAWSAWLAAGANLAFASLTSVDLPDWAGWGTLATGLWTMIAPAMLGFAASLGGFWSHLIAGGIVTFAAVNLLWLTSRRALQMAR